MYKAHMKKLTSLQKQAIVITGLLGAGFGAGSLGMIATREFAVSTMVDICRKQARSDRAKQDFNYTGLTGFDETTGECTYTTDFGHGLVWVQRWEP